jgi:hypothetical protein
MLLPVIVHEHGIHLERDHGPSTEGAASFHTARWTIVMRAAQGGQSALAELCRLYWYPLYIFARLRQEYATAGKTSTFEALKAFLDPNNSVAPPSYDEVAHRLQVTTAEDRPQDVQGHLQRLLQGQAH